MRALVVAGKFPLIYDGPTDPDKMWEAGEGKYWIAAGAKVGQNTVMRTRPYFPVWALEFEVLVALDMLAPEEVDELVVLAGRVIGLSDWRPLYGHFQITHIDGSSV